jgi:branched-chain amino acid transport system ATP-binding protein
MTAVGAAPVTRSRTLLEVHALEAFYGRTKALHGVSFAMAEGGITTILGANGAGKTTTLRAISRMVRTTGTVQFDGQSLERRAPEDIVRLGIAHAPEGRGTFVGLTVEENLRLGAWGRREKSGLEKDFEHVYGYFPVLRDRRRQAAGTLSGGEQQMLAVARALMLRPRLLLLDEPSLGLAPMVVREIFRILRAVNETDKVSILLVEQNAAMALDLADHVFLLETGRVVMEGPSAVLRNDDAIRKAYLGY